MLEPILDIIHDAVMAVAERNAKSARSYDPLSRGRDIHNYLAVEFTSLAMEISKAKGGPTAPPPDGPAKVERVGGIGADMAFDRLGRRVIDFLGIPLDFHGRVSTALGSKSPQGVGRLIADLRLEVLMEPVPCDGISPSGPGDTGEPTVATPDNGKDE